MKKISEGILIRLITSLLFTAVIAGTWDAWWHGAIGRDSLFEPPHILLYTATICAVLLGIYGWYKIKAKAWKRIALFLTLVPISAPFDELWHHTFGVEDLSSPLIVWSPPHLAIIFALAGSLISILPLIKKEGNLFTKQFLNALTFAGLINLLFFVLAPLQPTGPWHLLGFWGAGFLAAVMVGCFAFNEKMLSSPGSTFLVASMATLVSSFSFGEIIKPGVNIVPHDHPPSYVVIFSFLIPALLFDVTKNFPLWIRGVLVGISWAVILFGLSRYYFQPEFQYGFSDLMQAIFASFLGGIITAILLKNMLAAKRSGNNI